MCLVSICTVLHVCLVINMRGNDLKYDVHLTTLKQVYSISNGIGPLSISKSDKINTLGCEIAGSLTVSQFRHSRVDSCKRHR